MKFKWTFVWKFLKKWILHIFSFEKSMWTFNRSISNFFWFQCTNRLGVISSFVNCNIWWNLPCQFNLHTFKWEDLCFRVAKIYFGTRTHKQIKQIIRELRKTVYKDVRFVVFITMLITFFFFMAKHLTVLLWEKLLQATFSFLHCLLSVPSSP